MIRASISLKQAHKFLNQTGNFGKIKIKSEEALVPVLRRTLYNEIFQTHAKSWVIPDGTTLRQRIQSRDVYPDGAPYSPQYLLRKLKSGDKIFKPGVYRDFGFWQNIDFYYHWPHGVKVRWKRQPRKHRGVDYIEIHERHRSVIRSTFLMAWAEMMDTILETYKDLMEAL